MKACWIPRPEHPGRRRPQPVRADDVACPEDDVLPRFVARDDAGHPAVRVTHQTANRRAGAHLGPGRHGRLGQDPVEVRTTRSDQEVDPCTVLQRSPDFPALDSQGDCATGRRSRGEHFVQQPPAGQLDHSAAGQAVRREWVTEQVAALDHDHIEATSRQQPRGRRSSAAAADDDDVVGGGPAGHARSCGRGQRGGAVVLVRPTCSLRRRWRLTTAWRAGGGQLVTGDLSVVTVRSGLRPGRARPPRSRRVPPRAGAVASRARAGSAARCRRCRR